MSLSVSNFFISTYGQIGVPTWREVLDKTIDAGSLDTGTMAFSSSDLLNVRVMATLCIDNISSDQPINMRFNGAAANCKIAYRKGENIATASNGEATQVQIGMGNRNVARSIDLVYEPDRNTGTVNVVSYGGGVVESDLIYFRSEQDISRIEFYGSASWAAATYARLKVFELGV